MKTLKIFSLAAALLVATAGFAQEDGNRDANGKVVRGPYATNGFWANWFVSVGGGAACTVDGILSGDVSGGITPVYDIAVGKWIAPEFGVRLGYQGPSFRQYRGSDVTYPNHSLRGDFLWNLSNQFGGYKQTRVYNCVPYLSAGLLMSPVDKKVGKEFFTGAGLLNNFRINDHWGVNIDARAILFRGEPINASGAAGALSATVGITYNIGKCTWTRTGDPDGSVLAALKAANAELEKAKSSLTRANDELTGKNGKLSGENDKLAQSNKKLSDELDALKKSVANQKVEDNAVIYFRIGHSKLATLESQHLAFYLQNVDKAGTFTITGSADSATGSRSWNEKLCEARVNTIIEKLVAAGISRDQIVVKEHVISDLPEHPEMARRVYIEH